MGKEIKTKSKDKRELDRLNEELTEVKGEMVDCIHLKKRNNIIACRIECKKKSAEIIKSILKCKEMNKGKNIIQKVIIRKLLRNLEGQIKYLEKNRIKIFGEEEFGGK